MNESTYKVIEVIGASPESWEKAASVAIEEASKTLEDIRVAAVTEMDIQLSHGDVKIYRTKLKLSFKYHDEK